MPAIYDKAVVKKQTNKKEVNSVIYPLFHPLFIFTGRNKYRYLFFRHSPSRGEGELWGVGGASYTYAVRGKSSHAFSFLGLKAYYLASLERRGGGWGVGCKGMEVCYLYRGKARYQLESWGI